MEFRSDLTLQANTSFLFDVEAVVAPDPLTVVIQTKAPLPSLVPILSHPVSASSTASS